jgi:hypothetical protein
LNKDTFKDLGIDYRPSDTEWYIWKLKPFKIN